MGTASKQHTRAMQGHFAPQTLHAAKAGCSSIFECVEVDHDGKGGLSSRDRPRHAFYWQVKRFARSRIHAVIPCSSRVPPGILRPVWKEARSTSRCSKRQDCPIAASRRYVSISILRLSRFGVVPAGNRLARANVSESEACFAVPASNWSASRLRRPFLAELDVFDAEFNMVKLCSTVSLTDLSAGASRRISEMQPPALSRNGIEGYTNVACAARGFSEV